VIEYFAQILPVIKGQTVNFSFSLLSQQSFKFCQNQKETLPKSEHLLMWI